MEKTIDLIIGILLFATAYLSILQAIAQIIIRPITVRNYLAMTIFLCLFAFQLHTGLLITRSFEHFIHLFRFHVPALYLIGPATYLYFKFMVGDKWHKRNLLTHSILPVLVVLIYLPFYLKPATEKALIIYTYKLESIFDFLVLLGMISIFIYIPMTVLRAFRVLDLKLHSKNNRALFLIYMLVLALAMAVSTFALLIYNKASSLQILGPGLIVLSLGIFFFSQKHPGFFDTIWLQSRQSKYRKSHIENIAIEEIERDLIELLDIKKLYLKEDISLNYLAEQLSLKPHQLTQVLNEKIGKNFYHIINERRIQFALRILKDEPERTVLSIAYEVGFNSKSSFNTAFKRFVGKSPLQYRKSGQTKIPPLHPV